MKAFPRDLFSLDLCIDVELPDYKGNRLDRSDRSFRNKIAKWHIEYTPTRGQFKKLTAVDKFVLDVIEVVTKMVNSPDKLSVQHILPNFVKSGRYYCNRTD